MDGRWHNVEAILRIEVETQGSKLVSELPAMFGGGRHVRTSEDLITAIEALPEVEKLKDSMISIGFSAFGIQSRMLGEALILRALRDGCQRAMADLESFLRSDEISSTEIVLLGGISVKHRIDLGRGYYLCPPEDTPSEDFRKKYSELQNGKQAAFARKFDLFDTKVVGAALVREKCTQAKFVTLQDVKPHINNFPNLLTLVGPSSPIVYRHFFELSDSEFLKGSAPEAFAWSSEETRVTKHVPVAPSDFQDFDEIVEKFENLPEKERTHLAVSLHRLNEAVRHVSPVDKALDLGIALESLLLSGKREKEQLSLQFRLRGAWLLGRDGAHRSALYKQFQELYEMRSLAAHTGTVTTRKTGSVDEALAQGQRLCADAIKKVISHGGFPEWGPLLVGADYVVDPETGDDQA